MYRDTKNSSITFRSAGIILCYCILVYFDYTKCKMKLSQIFGMLNNIESTELGMNIIHNLFTRPQKLIRISLSLWLKIAENLFRVIL